MASSIDATKPVEGSATTASVRANFATAAAEITALQSFANNRLLGSISDYSATGDGSTDDRAALFNANAGGDFVLEPGTYSVQSALTLSNKVIFLPGAILKPASGITITISGKIDAGQYQIFDISAGGTITPSGGVAPCIYAEWYVTDMTGATLMGDELRAAVVFAQTCFIPLYIGTGTILVDKDGANTYAVNFYKVDVRGTLGNSTVTPSGSIIKLDAAQNCNVIELNGFSNTIENIAIDGNRTNQSTSNLYGLRIANYYNGRIKNVYCYNVKGYGWAAYSTITDGPNACYGENLFSYSCDHGCYIDTNAVANCWNSLGFQTINDGGTGTNNEYGMEVHCHNNTFISMYFEAVGTSGAGATGTSALIRLSGARGNIFLNARNQSYPTVTADYGILGASAVFNRFSNFRSFITAAFGTMGMSFDTNSRDNTIEQYDSVTPTSDFTDTPAKNHLIVDGQEYATYSQVGDNTTFDVSNIKYIKFSNAVTGNFTQLTGTAYAGYIVTAWIAAAVTFDFSGGGNLKGNNGANYVAASGDYIKFEYDGTSWHAFISQG